ncbi:MAG: pyridoxal-phosphate dependent enzyme [Candidatus Aenigmarchaeota archaeon]|nr:pyridoxal-phosphate dependent enzyme [Candidatus Aenigmarchaeota archaeon]MDI6722300.1 pyridoxal-phosphate dependent enzyme [Candidatus Aenigmarchaeota archaeon]
MKSIGITPLVEVPQLSGRYNAHVFVKDESTNPSGTFKDRRNFQALMNTDSIEGQ